MAHNGRLACGNVSNLVRDEDALSLCHVRWLTNPVLTWIRFHFIVKLVSFFRKHKSSRPKVKVMLPVLVLHAMDSICQKVLSSQLNASRKVIYLLKLIH